MTSGARARLRKVRFACWRYAEAYALVIILLKAHGDVVWTWYEVFQPIVILYLSLIIASITIKWVERSNSRRGEFLKSNSLLALIVPMFIIWMSMSFLVLFPKHNQKIEKNNENGTSSVVWGRDGIKRTLDSKNFTIEENENGEVELISIDKKLRFTITSEIERSMSKDLEILLDCFHKSRRK